MNTAMGFFLNIITRSCSGVDKPRHPVSWQVEACLQPVYGSNMHTHGPGVLYGHVSDPPIPEMATLSEPRSVCSGPYRP